MLKEPCITHKIQVYGRQAKQVLQSGPGQSEVDGALHHSQDQVQSGQADADIAKHYSQGDQQSDFDRFLNHMALQPQEGQIQHDYDQNNRPENE